MNFSSVRHLDWAVLAWTLLPKKQSRATTLLTRQEAKSQEQSDFLSVANINGAAKASLICLILKRFSRFNIQRAISAMTYSSGIAIALMNRVNRSCPFEVSLTSNLT